MVTDLVFDPLLPLSILVTLAALTGLLLVLAIWRGLSGWWLRVLSASVLLFALLNPSLRQEDRTPLSDIVLIVVDQSSSQDIADRPEQIAVALKN